MTATLSTHVLNLETGAPAEGLSVSLHAGDAAETPLVSCRTDADGRVANIAGERVLTAGNYTLLFEVAAWYAQRGESCFYPRVRIEFSVSETGHYHVPLLLNRHGYTTYRGS